MPESRFLHIWTHVFYPYISYKSVYFAFLKYTDLGEVSFVPVSAHEMRRFTISSRSCTDYVQIALHSSYHFSLLSSLLLSLSSLSCWSFLLPISISPCPCLPWSALLCSVHCIALALTMTNLSGVPSLTEMETQIDHTYDYKVSCFIRLLSHCLIDQSTDWLITALSDDSVWTG